MQTTVVTITIFTLPRGNFSSTIILKNNRYIWIHFILTFHLFFSDWLWSTRNFRSTLSSFPQGSFLVKGAITKLGFRDGWTKNTSEHCKNWTIELDIKLFTVSKKIAFQTSKILIKHDKCILISILRPGNADRDGKTGQKIMFSIFSQKVGFYLKHQLSNTPFFYKQSKI